MHAFAIQAEAQSQSAKTIADQHVLVRDADGGSGLLRCHASRSLDLPRADVERLLVVVHGALRDSDRYLAHAQAAAGTDNPATLIVAPQFLADVDLNGSSVVPDGSLYWDVESWKGGAPAIGPEPVSSFSAMDSLLWQLTETRRLSGNRNLSVVIIGNSAGGQYVNRYAAVGRVPDALADDGIPVHFIIANPSTYLYFDRSRPVEVPAGAGVNSWRYGFDDPPPYVDCSAAESLRRYVGRDVTIMLGDEDRDGAAMLLEVSAAAMAQGANRFERGINYHQHVQALAGKAGLTAKHELCPLAGIGHDAGYVLAAPETRKIMFG